MTSLGRVLWLMLPLGLAGAGGTSQKSLHDPLRELRRETDDHGRALLDAFASYDVATMLREVEVVSDRLDGPSARSEDPYLLAQGMLQVLLVRRFHASLDRDLPDELAEVDPDAWSTRALEAARRFAAEHPRHSDVLRVVGELHAARIHGMASAMIEGPKAKRAIDRALELDPGNGWAVLALGRMHYHNPSFAGGDKEKALEEFRRVARDLDAWRAHLYLARLYVERGLPRQARFWVEKALRAAPENPEALVLEERVAALERAEEGSR